MKKRKSLNQRDSQLELPLTLQRELLEFIKNDLILNPRELPSKLENLFGLYDVLPLTDPDNLKKKYFKATDGIPQKKVRTVVLPDAMKRRIEDRSDGLFFAKGEITIEVRAAGWEIKEDGKEITVFCFPGVREDKVEHALRKLAVDKSLFFSDNTSCIGVKFTIAQVQRILSQSGTSLSKSEIKEALTILTRSQFTLETTGGVKISVSGYRLSGLTQVDFSQYNLARKFSETEDELIENGYQSAVFHPLLTKSIHENEMRVSSFSAHAALNNVFARHIHKELRLNFVWAGKGEKGYVISLAKTLRAVGRQSRGMAKDLRDVRRGIEELVAVGILREFDRTRDQIRVTDGMTGKIEDYEFLLLQSDRFVDEMIEANIIQNKQDEKREEFAEFRRKQIKTQLTPKERSLVTEMIIVIGLSDDNARQLLERFGCAEVEDKIAYTKARIESGNVKLSPEGYFKAVLENSFRDKRKSEELETVNHVEVLESGWCEQFKETEQAFLMAQWSELKPSERENIRKYGFNSGYMQDKLEQWLKQRN